MSESHPNSADDDAAASVLPRPPLSDLIGQQRADREYPGERDELLRLQRGRLMAALVELSSEKGYESVSILEIVTRAGTSKRTFYEHFRDKNECLKRSFELIEAYLIQCIFGALSGKQELDERVAAGMHAYLQALREAPEFTRLFLSETSSHAPNLPDRWGRSLDRFGRLMAHRREQVRETDPGLPPLTVMQAMAATAGLNEMVRSIVFRSGVESLAASADELAELAVTLFSARRQPSGNA